MFTEIFGSGGEPAPDSIQRRRVLVVDDDEFIRRINAEILLSAGYEVDVAEDGSMAWDALQLHTYDLLVTDNRMPKMTGLELVGKIRDANLPLPIIMATGTLPCPELNCHHSHCPVVTLLKPYSPIELLGTAEVILTAATNGNQPVVLVPNWESQPQVFGLRLKPGA